MAQFPGWAWTLWSPILEPRPEKPTGPEPEVALSEVELGSTTVTKLQFPPPAEF